MSIAAPFQATGPSLLIAVTDAAQYVPLSNYDTILSSPSQALLTNLSTVNLWFAFFRKKADGTVDNTAPIAIPIAGTPASGIVILPGAIMTFSCPGAYFVGAIAGVAGPSSLIVVPGEGS